MRSTSRQRKYRLLVFIIAAFALLSAYAVRFRMTHAQSGPAVVYRHVYATYQYNTLKNPTGLLALNLSHSGGFHLYIADTGNHVIRTFAPGGGLFTVAGTLGTAGYVDGDPGVARFNSPTGIEGKNRFWREYDPELRRYFYNDYQELHVSDSGNFVTRKVVVGDVPYGTTEQVSTVAGNHTKGYADGSAATASFATLGGHTDGVSSCFMLDAENHCIRAEDATGNVTTFAGTGYPGFVDGYRTSALFNVPGKMTIDVSGNMYVADIGNNAIRKIDSAGYVTTLAGGGPTQIGLTNGSGSSASFYRPTSVVFNSTDSMLYVADANNHCIRRIDANGNVTTYAGTGQPGLVDGSLSQAQFNGPTDLCIYNGYMYISDTMNNVIRRIDMATGVVSTYIS